MKRFLKTIAVKAAQPWVSTDPSSRVVVLCYHSVHPAKSFRSATPELFEQHLQWISADCHVIPFSKIFNAVGRTSDRPTVAITFDDGYDDNFQYAFPLLLKYGLVATFFVTVGLIEKDSDVIARFRHQRQSSYDHIRPMEWFQLRDLSRAGMECGAHTYSHPNLALLNPSAASIELGRSKEIMEERLGELVTSMAYPFGKPSRHFTIETRELAAQAGYKHAAAVLCRNVTSHDSQLAVPRMLIARDNRRTLYEKIFGAWDVIGTWQEKAPLWLAKAVSPADFRAET